MKNKLLIKLVVPEIERDFDLYIPINKKVGNVLSLLLKSVFELTDGEYEGNILVNLFDKNTGERYDFNTIVKDTNIRNGTTLVMM